MKKQIEIYKIGTDVFIGSDFDKKLFGVIEAICIKGVNHQWITYQVCWWDGLTRRSEWLPPEQFELCNTTKNEKIGLI